MKRKGDKISGWLVIDKPKGMGSTQVVGKTRYLLHAAKNGHCGTLDPFATGVLPIAFGEATKLISYVMDGDKEYEFIHELESINDFKSIYKFSLGDSVDTSLLSNVKNYKIEAIPYRIVELYKKIVKMSRED